MARVGPRSCERWYTLLSWLPVKTRSPETFVVVPIHLNQVQPHLTHPLLRAPDLWPRGPPGLRPLHAAGRTGSEPLRKWPQLQEEASKRLMPNESGLQSSSGIGRLALLQVEAGSYSRRRGRRCQHLASGFLTLTFQAAVPNGRFLRTQMHRVTECGQARCRGERRVSWQCA